MRGLLFVLALTSCAPPMLRYASDGDRAWFLTEDKQSVWRCIDATPKTTPYQGSLKVFCKQAAMYSLDANPLAESAPPSSVTQGGGQPLNSGETKPEIPYAPSVPLPGPAGPYRPMTPKP